MSLKPSSAKAKGRRLEHQVAGMLGDSKRTPLSGAAGGNDITTLSGSIWNDWGIEAKARKKLSWTVVWQALEQARASKQMNQHPAVVVREDRGQPLFVAELADVIQWAEALADGGQNYKVKALLRQLRTTLDELERVTVR